MVTKFSTLYHLGPPSPVGDTAESAITNVVGAMSLSDLIEVLAQMKAFVITYPKAARQLLVDHPQIAYAVFMGLIISNVIPFDILTRMMEVNRSRLTVSNHLHLSAAGCQEWQKSENEDDGADGEFWRTEMLITEEELGHALRVLLIQPPEDIEALNWIYTYIANVVLPHATNSQEIYDTLTAAEPGDNWGDEQDTALVDQLFEQFCFAQT
ncbi:hypothetical protein B0H14DRAFT_3493922 [Mycena olivaceomarginata]|nr:hypothetical protein B0H14DRAFT_3493922 [Mycena olivaceomarginata]